MRQKGRGEPLPANIMYLLLNALLTIAIARVRASAQNEKAKFVLLQRILGRQIGKNGEDTRRVGNKRAPRVSSTGLKCVLRGR